MSSCFDVYLRRVERMTRPWFQDVGNRVTRDVVTAPNAYENRLRSDRGNTQVGIG